MYTFAVTISAVYNNWVVHKMSVKGNYVHGNAETFLTVWSSTGETWGETVGDVPFFKLLEQSANFMNQRKAMMLNSIVRMFLNNISNSTVIKILSKYYSLMKYHAIIWTNLKISHFLHIVTSIVSTSWQIIKNPHTWLLYLTGWSDKNFYIGDPKVKTDWVVICIHFIKENLIFFIYKKKSFF